MTEEKTLSMSLLHQWDPADGIYCVPTKKKASVEEQAWTVVVPPLHLPCDFQ
jgi:hypothetical protein